MRLEGDSIVWDLSQSIAKESISHLTIEEAEDAERCFVVQRLFVIGIDMGWDEIRLFLRIQAESDGAWSFSNGGFIFAKNTER